MILEGTQPMFTQVPPMVPRSISVTRAPRSAAFNAAAMAAPPLPMMAMCNPPDAAVCDSRSAERAAGVLPSKAARYPSAATALLHPVAALGIGCHCCSSEDG